MGRLGSMPIMKLDESISIKLLVLLPQTLIGLDSNKEAA